MERTMKVAKWGNSLAVRLPKALVDGLNLAEGDEFRIEPVGQRMLAVSKVRDRQAILAEFDKIAWELPEGYVFNRDQANER
jgi:antitoxin MazE